MNENEYIKYTVVDFLKDDRFLEWQLFNKEEDEIFWNNIIERDPTLRPVIQEAVSLYKNNIRFNDFKLTQYEISESLESFHNIVNKKRQRKSKRILLRIAAMVACITAIAILIPFVLNNKEAIPDITVFAQTLPDADLNSSDTKLIISENKTVILDNKESSIEYEADAIKADNNIISKGESSPYNQLLTPYGKRSMITFSDGTKAWINAGSRIVYPAEFSKKKREIYVDGEIYMEVSEDKDRPFIVKTKDVDVRVLGTKFNISAYESDKTKSVVLLSGAVSVSSNTQNKTAILSPNQMYSNLEGTYSVKNVDASIYVLWTKGLYQFESEKLRNIITRLERYYGINIECDNNVAELKCSGKLDMKDNLSKLLTDLSRALPIKYRQNANGSYKIYVKP